MHPEGQIKASFRYTRYIHMYGMAVVPMNAPGSGAIAWAVEEAEVTPLAATEEAVVA